MSDPPRIWRVGVVGFAHMHVNELVARFAAHPRAEIVACADTAPRTPSTIAVEGSRAANLARALALPSRPHHHADWCAMLAAETPDIVIACPENAAHAEVAIAALAAGAHVVTEKPMAASLADARRMAEAAAAANRTLAVNWPTTWRPALRRAQALVAAGGIGAVTQFRWRNPASLGPLAPGSLHPGNTVISAAITDAEAAAEWWYQAEAGGGALLDYCCYGACLAAWFLAARPVNVTAHTANLRSRFGTAEDNAALLLRFPDAVATIEASWTTLHNGTPNGPILHGTEATLVIDGPDIHLWRERGATAPTATLQGDPLPATEADIATAFLHHLETGAPLHPTLDLPLNLTASAILHAGARAARTGTTQAIPA